jgi:transcriptional regulator with XRE-family HTH domain
VKRGAMSDEQRSIRPTFAEKLNRLFATIHPRGRGEYTLEEVSNELAQRGVSISHTYIWQLRTGRRTNPSLQVIDALAEFFGVPPSYFFDEAAARRIDAQLEVVAALSDTAVRQLALRAADLSPASLQSLADLVERLRQLEGLQDGDAGNHRPAARPGERSDQ